MSRFTTSRERRALPAKPVHRRRERRPTGGGRFFRARPWPGEAPDLERLRDIFARVLTGTELGRKLGYDDGDEKPA